MLLLEQTARVLASADRIGRLRNKECLVCNLVSRHIFAKVALRLFLHSYFEWLEIAAR